MSLHTQLLRGVVALPVLLLLAVASVAAPSRAHPGLRAHAHAATVVIVADDGVVMVQSSR